MVPPQFTPVPSAYPDRQGLGNAGNAARFGIAPPHCGVWSRMRVER
jgi:hypothetical protein